MRSSPLDPDLLAHRALMATDEVALARHSGHYLPRALAVGGTSGGSCPVCLFLEMCTEYPGEVAASLDLVGPPRCRDLPDGSAHLPDPVCETGHSDKSACPDVAGDDVVSILVPGSSKSQATETEPPATKKENVLEEADRIVHGDRRQDYGSPRESFQVIASLWGPVFGVTVTPEQVALAMIELKVARILAGAGRDSIVDVAGYAGTLAIVSGVDDE
ncbi:MAG: DUF6378 domain-containing protein [Acidimicrobiales bacterium]